MPVTDKEMKEMSGIERARLELERQGYNPETLMQEWISLLRAERTERRILHKFRKDKAKLMPGAVIAAETRGEVLVEFRNADNATRREVLQQLSKISALYPSDKLDLTMDGEVDVNQHTPEERAAYEAAAEAASKALVTATQEKARRERKG